MCANLLGHERAPSFWGLLLRLDPGKEGQGVPVLTCKITSETQPLCWEA